MRRSTIRSRVSLRLVLLAVLAGCQSGTAPDMLDVSLVVSDGVVAPGDDIVLTIAATNVGSERTTVNITCQGTYRVLALDGSVVASPQFCPMTLMIVTRDLAPGEQIVYQHAWDATVSGVRLAPGEYRVVGEVASRRSEAVRVVVESR
jgi:hypothetical protein